MVAAVPRTSEFQVSKNSMCQSQIRKLEKKEQTRHRHHVFLYVFACLSPC